MDALRSGRRIFVVLSVVGLIATSACAAPPAPTANPGDTIADVVAKLGKPQGSMTHGRVTTYYYDRGLIYFVDGRVQTASLVTPEEAARLRREQDEAERQRRERVAAQQQQAEAARNEMATHRADAQFLALPPAERLAYWQDFQKRHPDLDVSADVAAIQPAGTAESRREQAADDLNTLRERVGIIRGRLAQLDADYVASRTTWKRNEINAERDKLKAELDAALSRTLGLPNAGRPEAGATTKP